MFHEGQRKGLIAGLGSGKELGLEVGTEIGIEMSVIAQLRPKSNGSPDPALFMAAV
jgi:hypothetical protein